MATRENSQQQFPRNAYNILSWNEINTLYDAATIVRAASEYIAYFTDRKLTRQEVQNREIILHNVNYSQLAIQRKKSRKSVPLFSSIEAIGDSTTLLQTPQEADFVSFFNPYHFEEETQEIKQYETIANYDPIGIAIIHA